MDNCFLAKKTLFSSTDKTVVSPLNCFCFKANIIFKYMMLEQLVIQIQKKKWTLIYALHSKKNNKTFFIPNTKPETLTCRT